MLNCVPVYLFLCLVCLSVCLSGLYRLCLSACLLWRFIVHLSGVCFCLLRRLAPFFFFLSVCLSTHLTVSSSWLSASRHTYIYPSACPFFLFPVSSSYSLQVSLLGLFLRLLICQPSISYLSLFVSLCPPIFAIRILSVFLPYSLYTNQLLCVSVCLASFCFYISHSHWSCLQSTSCLTLTCLWMSTFCLFLCLPPCFIYFSACLSVCLSIACVSASLPDRLI